MWRFTVLCAFFILLCSQETFAASKNEKVKGYATAYGFVLGQDFSLGKIGEKHPELASAVKLARLRFDAAFPKVKDKLDTKIKKIAGDDIYKQLQGQISSEIEKTLGDEKFTRDQAVTFLSEMEERSKGEIPPPALEYLLAAQYATAPVNEFLDGHRTRFSSKGHKKASGIDVVLQVPKSWEAGESERPHLVQNWTSRNDAVVEGIMLLVENMGATDKEIKAFIKSGEFKEATAGGKRLKSGTFTIENQPGYWVEYSQLQERVGEKFYQHLRLDQFFFRGRAISLLCVVTGAKNEKKLVDDSFSRIQPLCKQVLNSVVLPQVSER